LIACFEPEEIAMPRYYLVLLSLVVLALPSAQGGGQKKDAAKANEVEVKFADGSTVRMVLVQESIDIVTKFGRLTVPTSSIRGIDFGVHLPEGVDKKIEECIKKLSSEKFKDRDLAVNDLIELGAYAYPSLTAAVKTADLESQQRIQTAIKKIKAKVPDNLLRANSTDRIITTEFPIAGTIVSQTLKAKAQFFGDMTLKLTEMRSIAWVSGNMDSEISIDAAKYALKDAWLDTGVVLDGNTALTLIASGEIDLLNDGSGEFTCGPTGSRNVGRRAGNNRLPGALVAKIGESGVSFLVGERYSTTTAPEGKLYLQITPVPFNNGGQGPSGSFKVQIKSGFSFGQ
jgi:hypothetical protein